jgi:hypothetical protein
MPALEALARAHGCTTQVLLLHKMSVSDQIAQLRYNTSLLVGADGTGLLNAVSLEFIGGRTDFYLFDQKKVGLIEMTVLLLQVWMHECASVLRVNLWRKRGIVNKLAQGPWFEFHPSHNETVIYPSQLTFDPDEGAEDLPADVRHLENHMRSSGVLLNAIKDREHSSRDAGAGGSVGQFNFSGSIPDLSDIQVMFRVPCMFFVLLPLYFVACCCLYICMFVFVFFCFIQFLIYLLQSCNSEIACFIFNVCHYWLFIVYVVVLHVVRWKIFSEKRKAQWWTWRSLDMFWNEVSHLGRLAFLDYTIRRQLCLILIQVFINSLVRFLPRMPALAYYSCFSLVTFALNSNNDTDTGKSLYIYFISYI